MAEAGHNQPPEADPLDEFRANLRARMTDLVARLEDIRAGCAMAPKQIETDAEASRVTDFVKQAKQALKDAEEARRAEKKPLDDRGKIVQEEFGSAAEPLRAETKRLEAALGKWQQILAAREAERRREEERKRQAAIEAAEHALTEARHHVDEVAAAVRSGELDRKELTRAQKAEDEAEKAVKKLGKEPKKRPPAQVRGDYDSVGVTRSTWRYEVVDPSAVPRDFLCVDDAAVRAAIRDGAREIPGLRIFEEKSTYVR